VPNPLYDKRLCLENVYTSVRTSHKVGDILTDDVPIMHAVHAKNVQKCLSTVGNILQYIQLTQPRKL